MLVTMAEPLRRSNTSSACSRTVEWKGILDITETFRHLEVNRTAKRLSIDRSIRPNLRTSEECIRNLTATLGKALPSRMAEALPAGIDNLRRQMLLDYTESISQMVSTSEFTALDDSDLQRDYSRSIETWFDQAIDELFDAVTEQIDVSRSSYLPWIVSMD
jgi:hypothetical protein